MPSSATTANSSGRGRWFGLGFLSLGVSIIIVDATVVNVALPTIITELKIGSSAAEWVNSVYPLVFAALLLTLGRLGDRFGRRRLFFVGLTIFAIASLLAGLAQTGGELVAARVLQGVGGAAILPATLSIVNAVFRGRERAIAFAIWGSVIGGMAALGPLLGGWLVTDASWRWIFLVNLPLGIICAVGAVRFVPESRDREASDQLDGLGIALSSLGLGFLVFGLIEGQHFGWWTAKIGWGLGGVGASAGSLSPVPLAFALGAVVVGGFLWHERRLQDGSGKALIDFELHGLRSFSVGSITALIVSLGEFGLLFVMPLFLHTVLGYSALKTGVVIAALAAGAFVASPLAGVLTKRFGGRAVVSLGMFLEAVGVAGFALAASTTVSEGEIAIILFVYGVGVGFATAQLTSVILLDVPPRQSGQASALQSTARQLGSALGIAALGTILAVTLSSGAKRELTAAKLPAAQVTATAHAFSSSFGTSLNGVRRQPGAAAQVAALDQAYVGAVRRTGLLAAGFIALGLLLSFFLPKAMPLPDEVLGGDAPEPLVSVAADSGQSAGDRSAQPHLPPLSH